MSPRSALDWSARSLLALSLVLCVLPARAEEGGSWRVPGKNLAGFRYSDLDQINAGNVEELAVAWTFSR